MLGYKYDYITPYSANAPSLLSLPEAAVDGDNAAAAAATCPLSHPHAYRPSNSYCCKTSKEHNGALLVVYVQKLYMRLVLPVHCTEFRVSPRGAQGAHMGTSQFGVGTSQKGIGAQGFPQRCPKGTSHFHLATSHRILGETLLITLLVLPVYTC